jgi:hypothetical protein
MPKEKYDPEPFQQPLGRLIEEAGERPYGLMRAAGLYGNYLKRWFRDDHLQRPRRDACLMLAEYFDLNPNVFLRAAGHKPMAVLDFAWATTGGLSPPAVRVANKLACIEDQALQAKLV